MIGRTNLAHNLQVITTALASDENTVCVSWLPQYHDMGLIASYLCNLKVGSTGWYMSPITFIKRPILWIIVMSTSRCTFTQAPNFAFELAARKWDGLARPEEKAGMDLSRLCLMTSGGEPVRKDTMDLFFEKFGGYGLRRNALCPTYGMAENVVYICQAHGVTTDSEERVSCGNVPRDCAIEVEVVNVDKLEPCRDGVAGEIWVSGASRSSGYWGMKEKSEETFHARLKKPGSEHKLWLRTGDIGYVRRGQLYVTGRSKNMIISGGRNFYCEDIETAIGYAAVAPRLRPGCCAAFEMDAFDGGADSLVGIVAEVRDKRQYGDAELEEIIFGIKHVVLSEFGLKIHSIALIEPRTIPKTSSGKLRRQHCRSYLKDGSLKLIAGGLYEQSKDIPRYVNPQVAVPMEVQLAREIGEGLTDMEGMITAPKEPADTVHTIAVPFEEVGHMVKEMQPTERVNFLQTSIQKAVTEVVGSDVGLDLPLMAAGLSSMGAIQLMDRFEELSSGIDIILPPTLVFDYPTIRSIAGFMNEALVGKPQAGSKGFLGGSDLQRVCVPQLYSYSETLCGSDKTPSTGEKGRLDAISGTPLGRFDELVVADCADVARALFSGFLTADLSAFDATMFMIPETEASLMDPQQRLLLHQSLSAFPTMDGATFSKTGVYVGLSSSDYSRISVTEYGVIHPYSALGLAGSVAAGRISFTYGFVGPCVSIDTACSSSLVATHSACTDVSTADAIQGAVASCNLILLPHVTVAFERAHMLASDGRCKTLDAAADGYVRSESCTYMLISDGDEERLLTDSSPYREREPPPQGGARAGARAASSN